MAQNTRRVHASVVKITGVKLCDQLLHCEEKIERVKSVAARLATCG